MISAFSSLTLSPALCAVLLKAHNAPKDCLARFPYGKELPARLVLQDRSTGIFARAGKQILGPGSAVSCARAWWRWWLAAGCGVDGVEFPQKVPTGFVPTQDKQYLVAFAQLPDAASLDRTAEAVIRRMSDIGLKQPGVESAYRALWIGRASSPAFQRGAQRGHRIFYPGSRR